MAPVNDELIAIDVSSTVKLIGFHCWPEAHDTRDYLRSRHRHEFIVIPRVRVGHDDRDVEFHDLRDHVLDWWRLTGGAERGRQSCESMALSLKDHLTGLGMRVTGVSVSEDGNDTATVQFSDHFRARS